MAGSINKILNLVGNVGWRYLRFRVRHEVLKRTGLLKKNFPVAPAYRQYLTLSQWKEQPAKFFFVNKASLDIPKAPHPRIKEIFEQIKEGNLLLFNSVIAHLGTNYSWLTNPDTGFNYDPAKHWTEIADLSKEAGDIKYVWEKSRFSYLYDIIRYDYHFNEDCAGIVFADILSWIDANKVNCGPNYYCSQEMSLRVLNWTFAFFYYRDSPALTDEVFNKMQYAIYWHMHHVYNNIDFSRIAVRNNHAITETLTLYLAGMFYPQLPGAAIWKKKGKAWFEEEIAYQVYKDGTFLQFSMNYHRVVVQLLTWGITLSEKNGERFSDVVYDRAKRSVVFLRTCMSDANGWLPNYGMNDGALFFKLSEGHYRDYRPQLNALAKAIGIDLGWTGADEDILWYGIKSKAAQTWQPAYGPYSFPDGGYYVVRETDALTFIRCGSYKDRPFQADSLHLDIWYKGENILQDAGSYKYNTDNETLRYFNGTAAHNTVMLGDKDQMLKGGRFIWYYWPQRIAATLQENDTAYIFNGSISAYKYVAPGIVHKRTVIKHKGLAVWEIKDEVVNLPKGMKMRQLWHLPKQLSNKVSIIAKSADGENLPAQKQEGWYSSLYGQKEKADEIVFSTGQNFIDSVIRAEQ
jgi:hypothetical protein